LISWGFRTTHLLSFEIGVLDFDFECFKVAWFMITIPDPVLILILFFGSEYFKLIFPGNSILSFRKRSESTLISDYFFLSWEELLCEFFHLNELGHDLDFYWYGDFSFDLFGDTFPLLWKLIDLYFSFGVTNDFKLEDDIRCLWEFCIEYFVEDWFDLFMSNKADVHFGPEYH